jgi:VIT1/CCC1 family predicted Fe2+/Mn2+ transporter
MNKVKLILKEVFFLVKKHKYYFIAPILIVLAILAFLVYYIGPAIIVSFIYAGV